jgi:hypothetical protein
MQNLEKQISLKKDDGRYHLFVDKNSFSIKFTNNPFKNIVGRIYSDDECIGEIEKSEQNSKTYFLFKFYENATYEFYILILFSMCSVGITDSI